MRIINKVRFFYCCLFLSTIMQFLEEFYVREKVIRITTKIVI